MKKITIFALNLYAGGIEKYISLLCKMLEKDYKIEIITTFQNKEKEIFEFSDKVHIKYITNDYLERISIKKLMKNHHYFQIIKEMIRRYKLKSNAKKRNIKEIKNVNSDFIITTRIYHNKLVNKYLNNKKIITIATEHNFHNNNKAYINKLIKSVTNFNYMIHCTEELYEFYKDKIKGPKNIYIPNMIDIKNKKISKLNNKQILSVGRLSPEKGYLDLIEVIKKACELDKEIKLVICGDGEERELIEEKIEKYNLKNNIKLLGFLKGKKLEENYINSSLYILPSFSEAFGIVLLEAMHFGLPCLAFDCASGARNLLKNGTGILIENRDISKMSNTIVSLLKNKKLLKEYQRKSINTVKNFYLPIIYSRWKEILK